MKVIKPYRFIPKEEIERRAADVLMHVQAKRKRPLKWPIDAGHVAEALGLDMDCGDIPPDEPQKGIEWQAQYFASCLLMPVHILEQAQKPRDLTRWLHLYAMADELGVTISNLTNRLTGLGWIHIPINSKQIYLGEAAPSREKRAFG